MEWAPLLKLLDHGGRVFVPILVLSLLIILTGVAAPGALEAAGLDELWTDHRGWVVGACAFSLIWIATPKMAERRASRSEARTQQRKVQGANAELQRRIAKCNPAKIDLLREVLVAGSKYIPQFDRKIPIADALWDEGLLAKHGLRPGQVSMCYVYRLGRGVEPILLDMFEEVPPSPPPSP